MLIYRNWFHFKKNECAAKSFWKFFKKNQSFIWNVDLINFIILIENMEMNFRFWQ